MKNGPLRSLVLRDIAPGATHPLSSAEARFNSSSKTGAPSRSNIDSRRPRRLGRNPSEGRQALAANADSQLMAWWAHVALGLGLCGLFGIILILAALRALALGLSANLAALEGQLPNTA